MLGDLAVLGEGFVSGLFGGDDFAELGHGDLGQVAAGDLPLVMGLDDHGGGQSQERGPGWGRSPRRQRGV
jgi:hypothetical protein